jgi:hypothetical protein
MVQVKIFSTNDKIDLDSKSRGLGLDLGLVYGGDQITMLRDQIVITKKYKQDIKFALSFGY